MGCPYKLYVTLIKNMHNVLFIRHGVWQMFSPKNCCWLGRLLTIIGFCFTILDCPSVLLFFSWTDCLLVFSGWSGFSLFLSLDLFVVLTWASACINWPHVRTAFIVLSLTVITIAYLIFWGPLFLVTLFSYTDDYKTENPSTSHEVTLHVAFVHAFVNPTLFLVLHKGLRKATFDLLCCNFRSPRGSGYQANGHLNGNGHHNNGHHRIEVGGLVAPPPPIVDARGQIIEGVPHSNRTYMWVFPDMINTSFHSLIY